MFSRTYIFFNIYIFIFESILNGNFSFLTSTYKRVHKRAYKILEMNLNNETKMLCHTVKKILLVKFR